MNKSINRILAALVALFAMSSAFAQDVPEGYSVVSGCEWSANTIQNSFRSEWEGMVSYVPGQGFVPGGYEATKSGTVEGATIATKNNLQLTSGNSYIVAVQYELLGGASIVINFGNSTTTLTGNTSAKTWGYSNALNASGSAALSFAVNYNGGSGSARIYAISVYEKAAGVIVTPETDPGQPEGDWEVAGDLGISASFTNTFYSASVNLDAAKTYRIKFEGTSGMFTLTGHCGSDVFNIDPYGRPANSAFQFYNGVAYSNTFTGKGGSAYFYVVPFGIKVNMTKATLEVLKEPETPVVAAPAAPSVKAEKGTAVIGTQPMIVVTATAPTKDVNGNAITGKVALTISAEGTTTSPQGFFNVDAADQTVTVNPGETATWRVAALFSADEYNVTYSVVATANGVESAAGNATFKQSQALADLDAPYGYTLVKTLAPADFTGWNGIATAVGALWSYTNGLKAESNQPLGLTAGKTYKLALKVKLEGTAAIKVGFGGVDTDFTGTGAEQWVVTDAVVADDNTTLVLTATGIKAQADIAYLYEARLYQKDEAVTPPVVDTPTDEGWSTAYVPNLTGAFTTFKTFEFTLEAGETYRLKFEGTGDFIVSNGADIKTFDGNDLFTPAAGTPAYSQEFTGEGKKTFRIDSFNKSSVNLTAATLQVKDAVVAPKPEAPAVKAEKGTAIIGTQPMIVVTATAPTKDVNGNAITGKVALTISATGTTTSPQGFFNVDAADQTITVNPGETATWRTAALFNADNYDVTYSVVATVDGVESEAGKAYFKQEGQAPEFTAPAGYTLVKTLAPADFTGWNGIATAVGALWSYTNGLKAESNQPLGLTAGKTYKLALKVKLEGTAAIKAGFGGVDTDFTGTGAEQWVVTDAVVADDNTTLVLTSSGIKAQADIAYLYEARLYLKNETPVTGAPKPEGNWSEVGSLQLPAIELSKPAYSVAFDLEANKTYCIEFNGTGTFYVQAATATPVDIDANNDNGVFVLNGETGYTKPFTGIEGKVNFQIVPVGLSYTIASATLLVSDVVTPPTPEVGDPVAPVVKAEAGTAQYGSTKMIVVTATAPTKDVNGNVYGDDVKVSLTISATGSTSSPQGFLVIDADAQPDTKVVAPGQTATWYAAPLFTADDYDVTYAVVATVDGRESQAGKADFKQTASIAGIDTPAGYTLEKTVEAAGFDTSYGWSLGTDANGKQALYAYQNGALTETKAALGLVAGTTYKIAFDAKIPASCKVVATIGTIDYDLEMQGTTIATLTGDGSEKWTLTQEITPEADGRLVLKLQGSEDAFVYAVKVFAKEGTGPVTPPAPEENWVDVENGNLGVSIINAKKTAYSNVFTLEASRTYRLAFAGQGTQILVYAAGPDGPAGFDVKNAEGSDLFSFTEEECYSQSFTGKEGEYQFQITNFNQSNPATLTTCKLQVIAVETPVYHDPAQPTLAEPVSIEPIKIGSIVTAKKAVTVKVKAPTKDIEGNDLVGKVAMTIAVAEGCTSTSDQPLLTGDRTPLTQEVNPGEVVTWQTIEFNSGYEYHLLYDVTATCNEKTSAPLSVEYNYAPVVVEYAAPVAPAAQINKPDNYGYLSLVAVVPTVDIDGKAFEPGSPITLTLAPVAGSACGAAEQLIDSDSPASQLVNLKSTGETTVAWFLVPYTSNDFYNLAYTVTASYDGKVSEPTTVTFVEGMEPAVSNLAATVNEKHNVDLSFSVEKSVKGGKLSGDVAYTVEVDGEEVSNGTTTVGEVVNIKDIITNPVQGQAYSIVVLVTNDGREGFSTITYTYETNEAAPKDAEVLGYDINDSNYVAFEVKLPTEDAEGQALSALKVEVYRNGQLVATYNNVAPGTNFRYDSDEPLEYIEGGYTYTIKMYNGQACNEQEICTVNAPEPKVAPKPATNLQATVNGRDITLTATLPTEDIEGKPLSDDLKVMLMRNSTVTAVTTLRNLAAGAEFSYTDANKEPGVYTYYIMVYNGPEHADIQQFPTVEVAATNFGLPVTPTDFNAVEVSEGEAKNVEITFTLPTEDVNGNDLDYASLIVTITRASENGTVNIFNAYANTLGEELNADNLFTLVDENLADGTYTYTVTLTNAEGTVKALTADGAAAVVVEIKTQIINGINIDAADVEYYNLQGARVYNPGPGMYIIRQGSKVAKVKLF